MRLHLRADDGIRTRDPHLGKVMRYQLRYIRASRARCHHVRTETIVHPSMAAQISVRLSNLPIAQRILAETAARARVRPRSPAGSWLGARSRGSVGERPLHTRKVAGSIPAGTTTIAAAQDPSRRFFGLLWPSRVNVHGANMGPNYLVGPRELSVVTISGGVAPALGV